MSEFQKLHEEEEQKQEADVIEIEFIEPIEIPKRYSSQKYSEQEKKIIDIYHNQKAKRAAVEAKERGFLRIAYMV